VRYTVCYRLRSDRVERDHADLVAVYDDLFREQPGWLACRSLRLRDDATSVLVIDTEVMERLLELPSLCRYLRTLGARCADRPRADVVEECVESAGAVELGAWAPGHVKSRVP
jgi:hypothetical protein